MKTLTRKQFVSWLVRRAGENRNIWLLTGDLGFSFLEEFAKKYPDRFINCGVIEQSMMGIAAGLAMSGKKVFVYSTSTFLIFRPLEQIRNDIAKQNLDVTLVGTAGPQYHFLGYTHVIQDNEDKKILDIISKKIKYIRLV